MYRYSVLVVLVCTTTSTLQCVTSFAKERSFDRPTPKKKLTKTSSPSLSKLQDRLLIKEENNDVTETSSSKTKLSVESTERSSESIRSLVDMKRKAAKKEKEESDPLATPPPSSVKDDDDVNTQNPSSKSKTSIPSTKKSSTSLRSMIDMKRKAAKKKEESDAPTPSLKSTMSTSSSPFPNVVKAKDLGDFERIMDEQQQKYKNYLQNQKAQRDKTSSSSPSSSPSSALPKRQEKENTTQQRATIEEENSKHIIVVRFTAPWCKACKVAKPMLDYMSKKFPYSVFIDVTVTKKDFQRGLHQQYDLNVFPLGRIYHLQYQQQKESEQQQTKQVKEKGENGVGSDDKNNGDKKETKRSSIESFSLIEESSIARQEVSSFIQKLQSYVDGSCPLLGPGNVTCPYNDKKMPHQNDTKHNMEQRENEGRGQQETEKTTTKTKTSRTTIIRTNRKTTTANRKKATDVTATTDVTTTNTSTKTVKTNAVQQNTTKIKAATNITSQQSDNDGHNVTAGENIVQEPEHDQEGTKAQPRQKKR